MLGLVEEFVRNWIGYNLTPVVFYLHQLLSIPTFSKPPHSGLDNPPENVIQI